MYEVIRRKCMQVGKPDRQVSKGIYRPSGSYHSAQQLLASSISFYLHMYIFVKFLRRHMLHNFHFVHGISCANISEPSKSEKQTLMANSTTFAWCLAKFGDSRPTCREKT